MCDIPNVTNWLKPPTGFYEIRLRYWAPPELNIDEFIRLIVISFAGDEHVDWLAALEVAFQPN